MWSRLRSYSIAVCLFVFLFVVVGAGLHLKPLGAFLAALSGSFLVIHGVNRWSAGPARIGRKIEGVKPAAGKSLQETL